MYEPREQDVLWAKRMMSLLTENGVLVYPSTGLRYVVSHKAKMLKLENYDQLLMPESLTVHLRTVAVFKAIGYKVIMQDDLAEAAYNFETHQQLCSICRTDDVKTSLCHIGLYLMDMFYQVLIDTARRKGGDHG